MRIKLEFDWGAISNNAYWENKFQVCVWLIQCESLCDMHPHSFKIIHVNMLLWGNGQNRTKLMFNDAICQLGKCANVSSVYNIYGALERIIRKKCAAHIHRGRFLNTFEMDWLTKALLLIVVNWQPPVRNLFTFELSEKLALFLFRGMIINRSKSPTITTKIEQTARQFITLSITYYIPPISCF